MGEPLYCGRLGIGARSILKIVLDKHAALGEGSSSGRATKRPWGGVDFRQVLQEG